MCYDQHVLIYYTIVANGTLAGRMIVLSARQIETTSLQQKNHRPALVQHRFRQFWANIPFLYQNQADVTPRTNHVPIILNVYEYFVFFTFFYRSRIIPSGKETRVAILAPI